MKKYILILALLSSGILYAQKGEQKGDTTRITMKNRLIEIIEDSVSGRDQIIITPINTGFKVETNDKSEKTKNIEMKGLGLDLGFNLFMHNNSFNLPVNLEPLETRFLKSANVTLHTLPLRIGMFKNSLNLYTAIDFDFLQMAFEHNTMLIPNQDNLTWVTDSVNNYRKSKLNATYLQVPLLLGFNTSPRNKEKSFRLAAGGYYGILIGSHTKAKTENGDKVTEKDDFNLDKVRYGLTGRIGFRGIEFFANYNLSSLFREDQGPEITPLTVGINLIPGWSKGE